MHVSRIGLPLAALGALILTPDTLLMRLSGMEGLQMLGWRGIALGAVFWMIWALTGARGLPRLASLPGVTVILAQALNTGFFPLGVASAPVAVMLLSVATMPIWSALLSRLLYGEPSAPSTWLAMAAVLAGIALAVSGKGDLAVNPGALSGALYGQGVALCLGLSFVTLRHNPELPLLPAMGTGALISGLAGLLVTGPAQMPEGHVLPILVTGLVLLPASFFCLSTASRHTAAANVSLLILLETVLGPLWVWAVLGETPSPRMLAGGAIVVASLALYILSAAPRRPRATA